MPVEVVIPALDFEQDTARLVRWLKSEGAFVSTGEPLLEIETDKATLAVQSPGSGMLSNIVAYEGDEVPVGQVVALLVTMQEQPALAAQRQPSFQEPGHGPARGEEREEQYQIIPMRGPRRTTAERLQASYRTAPHMSLTVSVDVTELLRVLDRLQPGIKGETGLLTVLSKLTARTLLRYPRLNSHLVGSEIHQYATVHLGLAVSMEDELIVPVIHQMEQKDLAAIQAALEDLTGRARLDRLSQAEASGSTFTLFDLGVFGVEQFTAILNPPEVAILTVGAVQETPIGINGQLVLRPVMRLTLVVDQRAVDATTAAAFLKTLKDTLENPDLS